MRTSKDVSSNSPLRRSGKNSGFTLLELVIALTIISLVVLVLYQAFSMGVRVWDSEDQRSDSAVRLEATLRLVQDDLSRTIPYDMTRDDGTLQLFAGGPGSLYYVTTSGTGAFAGAGAGLFFSLVFVDECREGDSDCLFIFKSPRPCREYVEAVERFHRGTGFEREHHTPDSYFVERSVKVLEGLEDWNISYSPESFEPFAGLEEEQPDQRLHEKGRLSEDDWIENDLPGQLRIFFEYEGREYVTHVPVGQHNQGRR